MGRVKVRVRVRPVAGEADADGVRLELDDGLSERRVAHEAARERGLAVGRVHRQDERRVDGHGHAGHESLGGQRDVQRLGRLDAVRGELGHVHVHGAIVDPLQCGHREGVRVAAEAEDEGVPAGVLGLRRGERWGDAYREAQGDTRRCREIQGDAGRYREV